MGTGKGAGWEKEGGLAFKSKGPPGWWGLGSRQEGRRTFRGVRGSKEELLHAAAGGGFAGTVDLPPSVAWAEVMLLGLTRATLSSSLAGCSRNQEMLRSSGGWGKLDVIRNPLLPAVPRLRCVGVPRLWGAGGELRVGSADRVCGAAGSCVSVVIGLTAPNRACLRGAYCVASVCFSLNQISPAALGSSRAQRSPGAGMQGVRLFPFSYLDSFELWLLNCAPSPFPLSKFSLMALVAHCGAHPPSCRKEIIIILLVNQFFSPLSALTRM